MQFAVPARSAELVEVRAGAGAPALALRAVATVQNGAVVRDGPVGGHNRMICEPLHFLERGGVVPEVEEPDVLVLALPDGGVRVVLLEREVHVELHVGLPAAEPDVAEGDVAQRGVGGDVASRHWPRLRCGGDGEGAAGGLGGEEGLPAAVGAGRGGDRLGVGLGGAAGRRDRDLDRCAGRRAAAEHRGLRAGRLGRGALEHHLIAKDGGEAEGRRGLGAGEAQEGRGEAEAEHR